jgi:hypothetical protein
VVVYQCFKVQTRCKQSRAAAAAAAAFLTILHPPPCARFSTPLQRHWPAWLATHHIEARLTLILRSRFQVPMSFQGPDIGPVDRRQPHVADKSQFLRVRETEV